MLKPNRVGATVVLSPLSKRLEVTTQLSPQHLEILLWQGLASGFRSEWQHEEPQQENCAHRRSGVTHWFLEVPEHYKAKHSQCTRADGRHIAPDVIAERCAGAAQSGRIQLGKVYGITSKNQKLAETHQWRHPEHIKGVLHIQE